MNNPAEFIAGSTTHRRCGSIRNVFSYGVDFVLIDPEVLDKYPAVFSRNRFNLASIYDRDYGGPIQSDRGAIWARRVLREHGVPEHGTKLRLLTQPRFFGHAFNPVSFWLAMNGDSLIAAIAEVSTPFGDRHSYLCHQAAFEPITSSTVISAPKSLHVSPFQDVSGGYQFRFDIGEDQIAIRIIYRNNDDGVVATLSGPRRELTNARLLRASLRRPFGGLRTLALIHWQALRLKLKGAIYRQRPAPPTKEVTRCQS